MPSDKRDIQSAIQAGESESIEFKKIFDKEAIETLVAFANHKGGMALVGVEDSGRVAGVMCGPETIQGWVNQVKQSTAGLPTVITACPSQKSPICICIRICFCSFCCKVVS